MFFFRALLLVALASAELRFRINEDLGTLDWGNGEVSHVVVQQLMEGLTLSGVKGQPLPGIATRWSKLADGRPGYVFELRADARWSDGKRVCARHFVDAWERVLSKEFASPYAHYLSDIEKLRAVGCGRLEVRLKRPASYFPALTSHWVFLPIRADLMKKHGRAWMRPEHLVTTGPYLLDEWKVGTYYKLKRNPLYYGKPAREERLVAHVIGEDTTALTLFRERKLDWIKDLPYLERRTLSATPEYREYPAYIGYHLGFRMSDEGLSRDQRCALALALDKAVIPRILNGAEEPAWRLLPPDLAPPGAAPLAFDPARARKLWSSGASTPEELEVRYYSKDIHQPLMEWVQEEWRKNLGVRVKLVKMDGKSYWSFLQKSPPAVFLSGTTAPYAHPFAFLNELTSKSPANWGRFSSAGYDSAARSVSALVEGRRRNDAVAHAEREALERECAIVPLYFRKNASLVARDWEGVTVNPMDYVYLKTARKK